MNDAMYFRIANFLDRFYWRGRLLGDENLPDGGPAVFVSNHLGPMGPIGMVCSIHLRFYPWIVAEMVDRRLAPDFLRIDFVEGSLGLKTPLSRWAAKALSLITVPMLAALGCVPVHRKDYEDIQDTLQDSLALLKEGKVVLIYPEDSEMESDPQTGMRPFLKGFTRLGELYYEGTGKTLSFYPVAVHTSRTVKVGEPVHYQPDQPHGLERHHLKDKLEEAIKSMYLEMDEWER